MSTAGKQKALRWLSGGQQPFGDADVLKIFTKPLYKAGFSGKFLVIFFGFWKDISNFFPARAFLLIFLLNFIKLERAFFLGLYC